MLITLISMTLMTGGAFAQEVPEEPEAPQVPEAPDTPDAAEASQTPEAPEAPEAPEKPAAQPSLTFETSVGFEPVKKIALDGRAGDIELRGVEFTVSAAKGGVLGTSDADLKATIGVLLECATEAEKKAKFDLTVQFLDAEGNVIDRVDNSIGLKSGSKTFETKQTTLKYVVPLIKTVKISAVAK
jgi:hypothetical protein